jgi:hypothetical protein
MPAGTNAASAIKPVSRSFSSTPLIVTSTATATIAAATTANTTLSTSQPITDIRDTSPAKTFALPKTNMSIIVLCLGCGCVLLFGLFIYVVYRSRVPVRRTVKR